MSSSKFTLMGCGTSTGVPVLTCNCQVCTSTNPKNQRLRTSAFITTKNRERILIDAGTDLRAQALRHQLTDISALILTHEHADHVHGIDDLRPFFFRDNQRNLPTYCHQSCAQDLQKKFPYIFPRFDNGYRGIRPRLDLRLIEKSPEDVLIAQEPFTIFHLPHGKKMQTLGLVHHSLAYFTDCSDLPTHVVNFLKKRKLKYLLIDCLRPEPHPSHLHLKRALELIAEIAPQQAYFIHMSHEFEYQKTFEEFSPQGIAPAYDGLTLVY